MRMVLILLLACILSTSAFADDWDPNDDSFDPSIQSVVIGSRSWIGDPSPFKHLGSSRIGYTYVNATNYEGMDPAVQISLMVPLEPGETQPVGGGMLMLSKTQSQEFIQACAVTMEADLDKEQEPVSLKTAMKQANWNLIGEVVDGKRHLQLQDKTTEKSQTYQFSVAAMKKLNGAIKHSAKKLENKSAPAPTQK